MRIRFSVPVLLVLTVFLTGPIAFATVNPTPFIHQPLVPAAAIPGGATFTLTVNGSGFVAGSTVLWNGSSRPTTFVNASQLTAAIPATDVTIASTASVVVINPAPGGGASNVVFFQVSNPASSVAYTGNTVAISLAPLVATAKTVASDFNGDGKQDLATVNSDGSVSVLLGNGDGTFQPAVLYQPFGSSTGTSITVGDFNGDGKLDIAVTNSLHVAVLPGNGDGTFGAGIVSPINATLGSTFLAADLNRDGKLDLISDCESPSSAGLCVLLGIGDGTFAAGSTILTGSATSTDITASLADFNRDGALDLVVSYLNSGTATLAVALGVGDGTFGVLTGIDSLPLPTGQFNASVATADFDGDGISDVAYFFQSCSPPTPCTGNLQVYSGKGNGTFQPALPSLGAPAGNSGLVVGDFNGDGVLDIAVLDAVLLGHGDGTFAANPVPLAQNATVATDFNGDGSLDLAGPTLAGVFVQLRTPPDFTGFSSPTSQTFVAGTNTSYYVEIIPLYGWLSDVNLSVSGLPVGVTASFQPSAVPFGKGVSLLSLSSTSATTPGTYALTLTGTAGTISHSTTITLVVNPATADFGGDIIPGSQLVAGGQQANYTVQVVSFNGFTGDVTLSVSGLPPGSASNFNPPVITGGSGTSILTVVSPISARSGLYILTITGTSGGISHSGGRELNINTNADFTGSVNSVVSSVLPGQRASYAAHVVSLNGFTGTVGFSVSGLPAGATARFTPANVMGGSGGSSLLVTTSSTTPPGAYTLTIVGASASDSKSTTVPLLVNTSAGDFFGSINPTSQSAPANGGSAGYAITISPLSGFTGNVTLSVGGLPAGTIANFAPSNVIAGGSGTANLVITVGATPPGTYTILVTGTSGGLSHSGSITLTVN